MSFQDLFNIEKNFQSLRKGSLTGLVISVVILFFSYYDLLKLIRLDINNIIIFLCWVYLILNLAVANWIKYTNDKNLPNCPKCKRKLDIDSYKCKKCGKLKFEE